MKVEALIRFVAPCWLILIAVLAFGIPTLGSCFCSEAVCFLARVLYIAR